MTAVSGVKDSRSVTLRARLEADGGAKVAVTELLSGWPSVEWTELLDRAGKELTMLIAVLNQSTLVSNDQVATMTRAIATQVKLDAAIDAAQDKAKTAREGASAKATDTRDQAKEKAVEVLDATQTQVDNAFDKAKDALQK